MKYDGSNPLHVQQARAKLEKLIKEQKVFELTEKKPQRSLNQNKYLWLLIEYWATQTGYTKDEAEFIYKEVNKDIYFVEKEIAGIKQYMSGTHTNSIQKKCPYLLRNGETGRL